MRGNGAARAGGAAGAPGGAPGSAPAGSAPPEPIVFYGSLMEGLTLAGKPDLAALRAARVGACLVRGVLWDTGNGHPCLTRAGDPEAGVVVGELWTLRDPARALAALDAFEGTVPGDDAASEYLRVRTQCLGAGLQPEGVPVWIYVWNRPTDGMEMVRGGDWRTHLDGARRTRRR